MTNDTCSNLPYKIKERVNASKFDICITRKCNLKCEHCLCGDAENVTITPQIIDTAMSQFTRIDILGISMGETLLELDMFEYLLKSIDRYHVKVSALSMVTNGTIQNARLVDILRNFVSNDSERKAGVIISDDRFHDVNKSMETLKYYDRLLTNRDRLQIEFFTHSEAAKRKLLVGVGEELIYSGRARDYVTKHDAQFFLCQNAFGNHIVNMEGVHIGCRLLLDAKGGIGHINENSYVLSDKYVFGNILDDSIYNILLKHNSQCLHTCAEFNTERCYEDLKAHFTPKDDEDYTNYKMCLYTDMQLARLRRVWHIRELAQKAFPYLPSQEIIRLTPVPAEKVITDVYDKNPVSPRMNQSLISQAYARFPNEDAGKISEITSMIYTLYIINTGRNLGVYPFYSDDTILSSNLFKELKELERKYINGELKPQMRSIAPCANFPDCYDTKYQYHEAEEFKNMKKVTID